MTHHRATARTMCVLALALSACGAAGPSRELVAARETVEEARRTEAGQYKPDELRVAERTLARAERAHEDDPGSARERDLAYIADRQARVAMAHGREVALEARRAQAEREYRLRLEADAVARERQLGAIDEQLDTVRRELEDVREELGERESLLGERAEQLRAREEELVARQREIEEERRGRFEAERKADEALEELAEVRREQDQLIITLSGEVLFESGQTDLLPTARSRLEEVARVLRQHPDRAIVVEGHTDSRGPDDYNLRLSQARADTVRAFLVSYGVPAEIIRAVGRGETEPVSDNRTPEGRANNRRVEIIVEQGR